MEFEVIITETVTKRSIFNGDDDELDDFIIQVENGDIEFEEIPGTVEGASVEVIETNELD